MLTYSKTNAPFHLYTNLYNTQIGGMLLQDDKVLTTYSMKLNDIQKKYSIIDKELLAIDKYLQTFSNMVKGGDIFSIQITRI